MKKFFRFWWRTFKGIYDILATYLLVFLVPFCVAAVFLWVLSGQVATYFEFETRDAMWAWLSWKTKVPEIWLRLGLTLPVHGSLWWLLRRPTAWVQPYLERGFDKVVGWFKWATSRVLWVRTLAEVVFTLAVTAVLVPFLIQPTLVRGHDATSWTQRAANFADGTASAALADSVVGWYRKLVAKPVVAPPVSDEAIDTAIAQSEAQPSVPPRPSGKDPLMDRWDAQILEISESDLTRFATIKAFMWVESAGRQYAVSHTGCAGLMQFCAGTARAKPFKEIFGTGQVYVCACRDKKCSVPKEIQHDLESGDAAALARHGKDFPCELTDARFDPAKILRAGDRYIANLSRSFGGNVYLMYIGYNSGPMIAQRVWEKVNKNPEASLEEIELHLTEAMRPTYGAGAEARAKSLVRTHLPKLKKAQEGYLAEGLPRPSPASDGANAVLSGGTLDGLALCEF